MMLMSPVAVHHSVSRLGFDHLRAKAPAWLKYPLGLVSHTLDDDFLDVGLLRPRMLKAKL